MNLRTGLLVTILALGMSPLAIAAEKYNTDDPNVANHYDGQAVENVRITNSAKPTENKNPADCDCNRTDVGIRASTQPGQTAGSTGEGSGGARGIDQ